MQKPVVALVGYTNAGKSTLLNCLTEAGVVAEDKLFATLDPTTRRVNMPSGRDVSAGCWLHHSECRLLAASNLRLQLATCAALCQHPWVQQPCVPSCWASNFACSQQVRSTQHPVTSIPAQRWPWRSLEAYCL